MISVIYCSSVEEKSSSELISEKVKLPIHKDCDTNIVVKCLLDCLRSFNELLNRNI